MAIKSRTIAGFGKRIEYWLIGLMIKEGLNVYGPVNDYDGTDLVVKKSNGTYIEIQVKASAKTIATGYSGLFGNIPHKDKKNYFYIFYSEKLNIIWIMPSKDFLKYSKQYKTGKNIGKRVIELTGNRKNVSLEASAKKGKKTNKREEYVHERFNKYIATDFSRFK